MISATISFKHDSIHYQHGGKGKKLLFCFHGYGESSSYFSFLEKPLEQAYTLIAVDMPFHGKTIWKNKKEFSPEDLLALVEQLHKIHGNTHEKISVLGFSMGGRIALSLYQQMPASINKMILLAPDGLKVNFWYWLATQTWLGNRLFAFTIHHPGVFLFFLRLGNKARILNQSIYKFVQYYLHDQEIRKLLYLRWTCLRKLRPNLTLIQKQIKEQNSMVHFVYGRHDRIILSSLGEKFRRQLGSNCSLALLNCGHQVLHEKNLVDIIQYLPL